MCVCVPISVITCCARHHCRCCFRCEHGSAGLLPQVDLKANSELGGVHTGPVPVDQAGFAVDGGFVASIVTL